MNMRLFAKSILLILVAVLTGCGSDDPETDSGMIVGKDFANVPQQIVEKEELPVWLSEYIDGLHLDGMREIFVYQCKWKGEDIYYVHDTYSSCMLCSTFKSDGEIFDWEKESPDDFWKLSTDWKCIYLIRNFLHAN